MREQVRLFLNHEIGRRAFISRLIQLGVSSSVASSYAGYLEATPQQSGSPVPLSKILTDKTGGELIAEFLLEWEVPYVFGLGGSEEVGFLDALVDRTKLQYVLGLHEGSVMSMADGYAKASGQAAFMNLHSIAGVGYALGPMVNSYKDRTPVVITVGRQSTNIRGHEAFLEAANLHMVPRDYARWTWDLLRSETVPEVLRRAFLFASAPPGGPTFVTISKDFFEHKVPRAEIIPRERSQPSSEFLPDADSVKRTVQLLARARNPFIVAGRELSVYGGYTELVEIANLLGAPVFSDTPDSHSPIGFPTTHAQYAGLFAAEQQTPGTMDLFWTVGGTMFTQFNLPPSPLVPRNVPVIHTGLNWMEIGRNYPVDVAMFANVKVALRSILEEIRRTSLGKDVIEQRRRVARDYHNERARRITAQAENVWSLRPIASERLAVELNRRLDPNGIVVSELATSDLFLWNHLDFNQAQPGRRHITSAGGCLGWGVGAAIGTKIAQPDRQVSLLVGDGSFNFGVQGLWTAARYEVPVAVIIFNNRAYQANRRALHRYGGRASQTGKYIGCYLASPGIDCVALAKGYGVEGERVEDPQRLVQALDRCLKTVDAGQPYVVDVLVQPAFEGAESTWYDSFSIARRKPRES